MSPPFEHKGPFQLVTYDEERVEREIVVIENNSIYSLPRAVYMSTTGKLVYKDESPILTFKGEEIYWNEQGIFLSTSGRRVNKSEILSVNGKPLPEGTALMFKETLIRAKSMKPVGGQSGA